ncbi:hypothetical protein chiPu_0031384 [Chiloscyllium punctatum]|uniref:Clathrin/coatomer adaptor adaptin-like N-terminal domain-containing protein n=1 Tax=Chiloscyllium punctatum TaxID=137246 RepID=A0A401TWX2_CHIPU|nr:hypothetical protein [Chiloscyllium punctatum]
MTISVIGFTGKYEALKANVIPSLLLLVNDPVNKVRLNVMKAIATVSETPEGRKILLDHVELLQGKLKDPSEAVRRAVKITIDVITWKP